MRIVDRRFAAALLVLWLVLAVGLAAQADKPNSNVTMAIKCPTSPGCHSGSGGGAMVTGSGLRIKSEGDLSHYWLRLQTDPDVYKRIGEVNPDGTYREEVVWRTAGTFEVCLTYFKQSGQIEVLLCQTVVVLQLPESTTTTSAA